MKICLHQVFRPQGKNYSRPHGVGECSECKYDPEKNKECKKFSPINFEVVDNESTLTKDD